MDEVCRCRQGDALGSHATDQQDVGTDHSRDLVVEMEMLWERRLVACSHVRLASGRDACCRFLS
jgi:hypothetical protein